MISTPEEIRKIIEELKKRDMLLFHACHLLDFASYVSIGGVPSRGTLQTKSLAFTPFDSDTTDRKNGVWDLVFFNLQDFGRTFHKSASAVPSPYGPIMLGLDPEVLSCFSDLAICLRSAGARGFNRAKESVKNLEDFQLIFTNAPDSDQKRWIKGKIELAAISWIVDRQLKATSSPELSCGVPIGQLAIAPFKPYLKFVHVDPITFQGTSLLENVRTDLAQAGISVPMRERETEQKAIFEEIIADIAIPNDDLTALRNKGSASEDLKDVAQNWLNKGLAYQYKRYARYFQTGTLTVLSQRKNQKSAQ